MIRIAYLIDSLRMGGTEKQLVEMVHRLDRTQFDPVIICFRPSDETFVRGVRCEVQEIYFRSFKSIRMIRAIVQLVRFLRKRKIHIVQTFFFDAALIGIVGAKLAGVEKIISSKRDMGFWYDGMTLKTLRIVNRWVDRFWANSRAVAELVVRCENIPGRKIDVIYNGIELESFDRVGNKDAEREARAYDQSGPVIGIVANLNRPVKRVDVFLRAAALVKKRCENSRFVIVGDGHLRPELEALSGALELGGCVQFTGSRDDVVSILADFNVGVICSDSEGFSNSILEYFAMGIPVIATDVGGNREIVEDDVNGYLVPREDYETLADRISQLIENEHLRKTMGDNGKQKVDESFHWSVRIDQIQNYYNSLFT